MVATNDFNAIKYPRTNIPSNGHLDDLVYPNNNLDWSEGEENWRTLKTRITDENKMDKRSQGQDDMNIFMYGRNRKGKTFLYVRIKHAFNRKRAL